MIAIRILCLLLCECFYFLIVRGHSTVNETTSRYGWSFEEFVLQTFQRAARPTEELMREVQRSCDSATQSTVHVQQNYTHQLLMEVKRSCDNVSASSPEHQYTHQLLMQMKRSMDNISAQLMTIKGDPLPQSGTTERDVDEKQQFVSALTGECVRKSLNVAGLFACRARDKRKLEQ